MTASQIYQETDRCVKCGLCLPHCPTYLQLADEAESPRGRVALIQALVSEQLPLTDQLQLHLDRCLGCRACEQVCPSGVKYGQLIDEARVRIRRARRGAGGGLGSWLLAFLSDRDRLRKHTYPLAFLRRSGVLSLVHRLAPNKLKPLLQVASILPDRTAVPGLHAAQHPPRGSTVELFIGCVSSMADHSAIQAAIAVLTRLGYAVNISRNQTCCGALYRHNGLPEKAQQLCDQNRKITQTSRAQALITIATACQLELLEQQASHIPVISITNFVLQHLQLMQRQADLKSISGRVLLHMPCTARKEPVDQLLGLIPGLTLELFPDNGICCGAAGSYLLTQPKLATQLGEDKLEHLKAAAPSILVTSNTGCAIQFRRLLKREKLPIEVLHPIELINRQLS